MQDAVDPSRGETAHTRGPQVEDTLGLGMLNAGARAWRHSVSHGPSVRDAQLRVLSAEFASPLLHGEGYLWEV